MTIKLFWSCALTRSSPRYNKRRANVDFAMMDESFPTVDWKRVDIMRIGGVGVGGGGSRLSGSWHWQNSYTLKKHARTPKKQ